MAIDPAWAAVLGAAVGGVATLGTTVTSAIWSARKERDARDDARKADATRWEREQLATAASWEREQRGRVELWQREQLQSVLLSCTYQLDRYITMSLNKSLEQAQDDPALVEASAEAKKWLIAVLLDYPSKTSPALAKLRQNVFSANSTAVIVPHYAWETRQLLVDLALEFGFDSTP